MKKMSALLLGVLLVVSVVMIAFAAQSVQFTVTPAKTEVTRGETIEFTIAVSEVADAQAAGFSLVDNSGALYDTDVFEFIGGEHLDKSAFMGTVGVLNNKPSGSVAYLKTVTLSGDIFTFQMKVLDNAPFGETTLTIYPSASGANSNFDAEANTVTLTVVCNHSWGDWTVSGDTHTRSCGICGETESAKHTAQGDLIAGASSHWYLCACGAKVEEAAHSYNTGSWTSDAVNHWHACACGAKADEGAHVFTEKLQDAAHQVSGSKVTYYYDCAYCDTMGTETYTVVARGDMDCDGDVDVDDSIYLLQHVLMPGLFPLD